MIDVEIRGASPSDGGQLRLVEDEARRGLDQVRGGVRWLEEHPPIDWDGTDPRQIIVAAIDGVIVGYLALDLRAPVAVIDQVFVAAEARGIGIGDSLLAEALQWATAAGAEYLEAVALPGDRDTKNLYERAGIVARSITVSTRLDRPVSDPAIAQAASRRTP